MGWVLEKNFSYNSSILLTAIRQKGVLLIYRCLHWKLKVSRKETSLIFREHCINSVKVQYKVHLQFMKPTL